MTKVYEFKVTIREGSDEFWEELDAKRHTGIDDILDQMRTDLSSFDAEVELLSYRKEPSSPF